MGTNTPKLERDFIRIVHLVLSIPILGYLYGPVESIPQAALFVRWIAMPVVILSGFWLWLKPRVIRRIQTWRKSGALQGSSHSG
jgi:hypothetical protein